MRRTTSGRSSGKGYTKENMTSDDGSSEEGADEKAGGRGTFVDKHRRSSNLGINRRGDDNYQGERRESGGDRRRRHDSHDGGFKKHIEYKMPKLNCPIITFKAFQDMQVQSF